MANIVFTPNQNAWVNPDFFANLYKQRHDLIEKEETTLSSREDALSALESMLDENVDIDAVAKIRLYKDKISEMSKGLSSKNSSLKDIKKQSKELWGEIAPIILEYEQDVKTRDDAMKEIYKLKNQGYIVDKDYSKMAVGTGTIGRVPNYTSLNTEDFFKYGQMWGNNLAKNIQYSYSQRRGKDIPVGFVESTMTPSLTAESWGSSENIHYATEAAEYARNSAIEVLINKGLSPEDATTMVDNNIDIIQRRFTEGILDRLPGKKVELEKDPTYEKPKSSTPSPLIPKYDTMSLVEVGGADRFSSVKSLLEDPNQFNEAFTPMFTEEYRNAKNIKGYNSIKDETSKKYVDNAYDILGKELGISKDELALFFYGIGLDNDRRTYIGNAIRTYNAQAEKSDKWYIYTDDKKMIGYPKSGMPAEHYNKFIENSKNAKLLESLGIDIKNYDNVTDLYNAANVAFNDPSVGEKMGFGKFEAPQYSLSGEARNKFISYITDNPSENVIEWNAKGKDKDTGQTVDMTTIDAKNIGDPYFIQGTGQLYVNVTVDGKQKTINITNKMPNSVKSRISKASQDIEYIESAEQILEYAIATGNKDLIERASKNLEVAKNNYTGGINELFTNLGYTIGSKNLLTGN